ncbi:Aristolochene synthase [Neolecta irregularis DAH-3]|uniref:Terpene synthase n=1 Tax=Neolecta irregularis (strain DAH-3) TaxID=1198029 RepID=A0A1U7LWW3_NEOID|nr:Aristolochene synthase [Neolecta irregularis DAH-3]|eukprot:OLL27001.1 Aristolochene synthase [Neolecta irregularis DAH-3]
MSAVCAMGDQGASRYLPKVNIFGHQVRFHQRSQEIEEESDQAFLDEWPWPSKESRQKFIDSKYGYCTVCSFPDILSERIRLVADMITLFFLLDDYIDECGNDELGSQIAARFLGIFLRKHEPINDIERKCAQIWCKVETIAPDHVEVMQRNLIGMYKNTRSNPGNVESFQKYLQYRQLNGGYYWSMTILRMGMDIKLEDAEYDDIREIDSTVGTECILINDIFSYRKEFREGYASANSVEFLHRIEGLSRHEAWIKLAQIAPTYFERYLGLKQQYIDSGRSTEQGRKYVDSLSWLMAGHEYWSGLTGRYK